MNKKQSEIYQDPKNRFRWNGKIKDILLLATLALALTFATWKIFYDNEKETLTTQTASSETEQKISKLLEQIDGVGKADVMIYETEEGISGAVVVCEGADNLQVIIDVREAVAAALGMEEKAVKIYQKKE